MAKYGNLLKTIKDSTPTSTISALTERNYSPSSPYIINERPKKDIDDEELKAKLARIKELLDENQYPDPLKFNNTEFMALRDSIIETLIPTSITEKNADVEESIYDDEETDNGDSCNDREKVISEDSLPERQYTIFTDDQTPFTKIFNKKVSIESYRGHVSKELKAYFKKNLDNVPFYIIKAMPEYDPKKGASPTTFFINKCFDAMRTEFKQDIESIVSSDRNTAKNDDDNNKTDDIYNNQKNTNADWQPGTEYESTSDTPQYKVSRVALNKVLSPDYFTEEERLLMEHLIDEICKDGRGGSDGNTAYYKELVKRINRRTRPENDTEETLYALLCDHVLDAVCNEKSLTYVTTRDFFEKIGISYTNKLKEQKLEEESHPAYTPTYIYNICTRIKHRRERLSS